MQNLLDWWDMKPFQVNHFLGMVRTFQKLLYDPAYAGGFTQKLGDSHRKQLVDGFRLFIAECQEMALPSTADQAKRIVAMLEKSKDLAALRLYLPEAINRLEDECTRKIMMFVEPNYVEYFSNAQFFDSKDPDAPRVSVQFPSAAEDIAESGKCLACGRSTACVMHLGRVMEVGLKALAGKLGTGPQNDWGKYLDAIDKELQKRMKASGARTRDEQFYAESYALFDSVRRAWRNPAMHVDKTYTEEHAEEILIAARSLMRHLATKLHD